MTTEIGDILISKLENLPFIDRFAGVVKPVVLMTKGVRKVFPAATRLIVDGCEVDGNTSVYGDLCPDSRYKSLLYLEDRGNRFVKSEGGNQFWRASYDIVCWLNLPRLGYEGMKYSAVAMHGIISKFPTTPFKSGIYNRIAIRPSGQGLISQSPFERYSYDEAKTQLLLYPYDYFVLSVDIDYCVNKSCMTAAALGTPAACLSPNIIRNAIIEDQDGNIVKYLKANERYRVVIASGIDEGGPSQTYSILVVDAGLNT